MGMSIEKAHEILSNGLVNAPSEHEWCEAFKTAMDTMCKYQKIQTRLDGLEHSMECLLESDPRSFTNRECENGWLFDRIIEWRKVIREVLRE